MPEMTVSFLGALNGNADVAIGNVVGSNIFNVFGILGLTAVFFPVTFDRQNLKFEIPFCIGVSAMLVLLSFNFFNGTSQCVNRIGEIYNIPALQSFYPADLPPRPEMPLIPSGLPEEEERRLRLNVCYDIAYDDALLRQDPGQFEKLRGSYRMRREPEKLM